MTWIRQATGRAVIVQNPSSNSNGGMAPVGLGPGPDGAHITVTDNGPQKQGLDLLQRVRMEICAGNTNLARHMVEDVRKGPYGLQADADALLRLIDTEELEQRRHEARRTLDAGHSAFLRRDDTTARLILASIDIKMLEPDQQTRLREDMSVPEMQPRDISPTGVAQGPDSGTSRLTEDSPEAKWAQQTKAITEVVFQKFRNDGLTA